MKSVKMSVVLFAALTLSTAAQAAQENRGVALCKGADVECRSTDKNDPTNVCIFNDSKTADVTSPSDQLTIFRNVQIVPSSMDGAGLNYKGPGFSLKVATDILSDSNSGTPGFLTALKLQIQNQRLSCTFKSKD